MGTSHITRHRIKINGQTSYDKWVNILGYFFVAFANYKMLTPFANQTNTVCERS